jgi:hypothetical protein
VGAESKLNLRTIPVLCTRATSHIGFPESMTVRLGDAILRLSMPAPGRQRLHPDGVLPNDPLDHVRLGIGVGLHVRPVHPRQGALGLLVEPPVLRIGP